MRNNIDEWENSVVGSEMVVKFYLTFEKACVREFFSLSGNTVLFTLHPCPQSLSFKVNLCTVRSCTYNLHLEKQILLFLILSISLLLRLIACGVCVAPRQPQGQDQHRTDWSVPRLCTLQEQLPWLMKGDLRIERSPVLSQTAQAKPGELATLNASFVRNHLALCSIFRK